MASPAPVMSMLGTVTGQLAEVTRATGRPVHADPSELISGRAALAGFSRRGQISAGGGSYLLPAVDGWCAVTLSRPDDLAAVPAILGALGLDAGGPGSGALSALAAAAAVRPAEDLASAAQLLGVPAAALPPAGDRPVPASWPPWQTTRIARPSAGVRLAGAVVADLSSMWAGPLCARLLGLAGAHVIKVESPDRPDGGRSGPREFFDWLHAGHRSVTADFRTGDGRSALRTLIEAADIVIEASRPRALAALGLAPETMPHRDGQVWLSITGYGRTTPDQVAFGDDAAVAGGLVGWVTSGPAPEPVFCADAIADPLTGVCGALVVARSLAAGGGELIDLPMREVAGVFAAASAPDHGPHEVRPDGSVSCPSSGREQAVQPPRRLAPLNGVRTAAEPGADTAAVFAWLAGRRATC
ncbi:MAG TPA: CoA transferase [Trebonia sp.]|nr:CoA transferase [Trebonia sp.]